MVTLELMKAISAAFNSRDVERIVDCFADDGIFCLARGPESVGYRPAAIANVTRDVVHLLSRYAARKSGVAVSIPAQAQT